MRLGVLGGSYNPPHNGHLLLASDAYEELKLDRLLIVPAFANPLKGANTAGATPPQRFDMASLAFAADARFEVSSIEIDRGGLSFTVDTLEELARQHPAAELVLLMGADSLRAMEKWKAPDRIRELARIAVLVRKENGVDAASELPGGADAVATRRIDISSSEIRSRLAAGMSVKGYVAESVERYISAAKLYGPRAAPDAAGQRGAEER